MKQIGKRRRLKKRYVVLIVATLALLLGGFWAHQWYREQLLPVSDNDQFRYITIESGMSSEQIANLLEEEGMIRNALAFRLHARARGLSHGMQAGFYSMAPNQSTPDILSIIAEGRTASTVVRIPGGSELRDIEDIFVEAGFDKSDVAEALDADYDSSVLRHKPENATLEGYLFPDTYHIAADASVTDMVEMILANTEQQLDEDIIMSWRTFGLNVHEGLTLASIIQKEAPDLKTQSKVSQVFHRRLEKNIMLQADPTYLYAARLTGRRASHRLDSPYNTYRHHGLPPGPIATVERDALVASANPSSGEYLYFVTGTDGITRFSKTREEHDSLIDKHGISGT